MGFPVKVLINTNPLAMLPVPPGGVRAGDTFASYAFDVDPERFREALKREGLPADFRVPTDHDLCEAMFRIGNDDDLRFLWPPRVRSLSVGDVVIIGENAYACEGLGWRLLTSDEVRSFTIKEAA